MLAAAPPNGLAALPRSSTWLTGIVNIVEAAASLGDAELAREAYSLLEPYADRPAMPSLAVDLLRRGRAGARLGGVDVR